MKTVRHVGERHGEEKELGRSVVEGTKMRQENNSKELTVFRDMTLRTLCCRLRQHFFQNVGNFFRATYPRRGLLLRSMMGET
jgi:hypothetical protein